MTTDRIQGSRYSRIGKKLQRRAARDCCSPRLARTCVGRAVAVAANCRLTLGDQAWTSQAFTNGHTSYNGFIAEVSQETGEPLFSMRFGGSIYDMVRKLDATSDGHYRILGVLSGASGIGGITPRCGHEVHAAGKLPLCR